MHQIIDFIVNIAANLGYTWILIMMIVESSFIPFPSELAMIPAGYLSSTWEMNFIIALWIWSGWAIIWATINYMIALKLWEPITRSLIHKYWKYIFISDSHYIKAEKYFEKHWSITTFLARFIPAVRQLISLPAWAFKMNFAKFVLYTWLGAWIWNLILMIIWYIAWENKELIAEYSKEALLWVISIWVLIGIIYYLKNKNAK